MYGMLAVVSALVLWQSGALASEPEEAKVLTGLTAQGHRVHVRIRSGRVLAFSVSRIDGRCRNGRRWSLVDWRRPLPDSDTVHTRDGAHLRVRTFPLPGFGDTLAMRMHMRMDATIQDGGEAVRGVLGYSASPGGVPCASGDVDFGASR